MAWQRNYVVLTSGERVRYGFVTRADSNAYFVRFKSADGRRLEKSTGAARKPDAVAAAHRLILEEYRQVAPAAETVTWEAAEGRLRSKLSSSGLRPKTVDGYLETLAKLKVQFPLARGPGDVTPRMAEDFKQAYAAGTFTRRKNPGPGGAAPAYARKAKSLDTRLRTLKAVFKHFLTMSPPLVGSNPFAGVTPPKLDRDVKYVTRTDVGDVFAWLDARYGAWGMPKLFFRVKALTACRLDDLCSLPASALRDGGLVFPAGVAKHRRDRFAKLPADVAAELDAYKGPKWLWERYPAGLRAANVRLGFPVHRMNPEFSPRRLYLWVVQTMQTYQKQTGRDFSSHDFRKAAFTRAAEKDLHPKKVASGFGVTAETMLKYYTAVDQRKAAEEVGDELAGDLDPTRPQ